MSKHQVDEILKELLQICQQYKAEVPSHRRAWPMAVKSRVFELRKLGLRDPQIASRAGLCYQTLRTWKTEAPSRFLPVTVTTPTVTVEVEPLKNQTNKMPIAQSSAPTMTIITPTGYRIEGLNHQSLIEVLGSLK